MVYLDYIAEIKALAKEGYALGIMGKKSPNGKIRLFEPKATMKQIRDFERDLCVTLPVPLVRYLTELGNGGVGADYGIYSLDTMRKRNPSASLTNDLPPMLDHSLTDEQWTDFAKKYATADEYIDRKDATPEGIKQAKEIRNNMELQLIAGGIFVSTPGCTMNTILMCRGAAKGEVFMIDWDYIDELDSEPWCSGKFEDWIITDMRRRIENHKNKF